VNVATRTIFTGDNFQILRGMNSQCVDLIYLDPPFNSNANYAAPIGSKAAGSEFKDTWTLSDIDVAWHGELARKNQGLYNFLLSARAIQGNSMLSYLIYMSIRLLEMHRLLKDEGSIYLHCDPTTSHYLKGVMDSIFGKKNFRNEIIWAYRTGGAGSKKFAKKHDVILFYSKTAKYTFNPQKEKSYSTNSPPGFKGVKKERDEDGRWYTMSGMRDVWQINAIGRSSKERVGYPTQKPLALLDNIIISSSNKGDVVLDPFCGCATTCIAAEKRERKWVGIDISPKAAELVSKRAHDELTDLFVSVENEVKEKSVYFEIIHRKDTPKRTDMGKIARYNAKDNKDMLYGKQQGYCKGCKIHFPYRNMTVDHIVPIKKSGTDHIDNLQLLCGACNSLKGDREMSYLISRLKIINEG